MHTMKERIDLSLLAELTQQALPRYSELTDGKVEFDVDQAARLEITPDKPNYARSETVVRHLGQDAAKLYVIAFEPHDGTGDENTHKLKDIRVPNTIHPSPKVVPRSKSALDSEVHLTIASIGGGKVDGEPELFAGNMAMLSIRFGRQLMKVADLGQPPLNYVNLMYGRGEAEPTATLTTGYKGMLEGQDGNRFGDPHSVYNSWGATVQLCGFIGITPEAAPMHRDMLRLLRAQEPEMLAR